MQFKDSGCECEPTCILSYKSFTFCHYSTVIGGYWSKGIFLICDRISIFDLVSLIHPKKIGNKSLNEILSSISCPQWDKSIKWNQTLWWLSAQKHRNLLKVDVRNSNTRTLLKGLERLNIGGISWS